MSDFYDKTPSLVDMTEFVSWIVLEDEDLLAINKPAWLVCHPSKNGELSSLVGAVRVYLKGEKVHLISRLDRETSGIVLFAKNAHTASLLQKSIQVKNNVKKTYLAILEGSLDYSVEVNQSLENDDVSKVYVKDRVAIGNPNAKSAGTIFRPISKNQNFSLVKVELLTGKKHQIRIHSNWIKHPIVGDKLYGFDEEYYLEFIENGLNEKMMLDLKMTRQALHCFEMDFSKIISGLILKARIQSDFLEFVKKEKIYLPKEYNL